MSESSQFWVYPEKIAPEHFDPDHLYVGYADGLQPVMRALYLIGITTLVGLVIYIISGAASSGFVTVWNRLLLSLIPALIVGFIFMKYMNKRAEDNRNEQQRRAEEGRLQKTVQIRNEARERTAEQKALSLTTRLRTSYDQAPKLLESLYTSLDQSLDCLEEADREYEANAFSPFWDAVESATIELDKYRQGVNRLVEMVREYDQQLVGRVHNFPPYPVRNGHIPDSTTVVETLQHVVRLGQTNFQFANIWEHRRTRGVMITGFRTLEEAVNNLGAIVENSISDLQESISHDMGRLHEEISSGQEAAAASNAALRDAVADQTKSQSQASLGLTKELGNMKNSLDGRLSEHSAMLDNIRRGRKPGILAKDYGYDR